MVYTIGHAARLSGVPSATIRAWERRYGLVRPVRTDGGYRLYDEQGLQLLRAMAALVAAGWSPSQAAEHLRLEGAASSDERQAPWEAYLRARDRAEHQQRGDGSRPLDSARRAVAEATAGWPAAMDHTVAEGAAEQPASGAWDVTALVRGAAELDPAAVDAAVDAAFAAGPLEEVVEVWLMPALEMLGLQWRAGRIDVAGEHVVSATVHRRLGAEMRSAASAGGPRVAVGLPRDAHHELGMLAFAVLLRRAGLDVVYLGADLPAQHWVRVVEQRDTAAVVVGAPTAADVVAARETVAALHAARPGLAVYVGGGAQFEVGEGTRPLGHGVAAAAAELSRLLQ
ncbi:DNA-binding transcriptional regulator, MerR family [Pedococcus dokdonensis]|uniref:DNA-binding transcriptional regulator, MerR family n=1 Tax=Pedococcus dokdonensis TaxID=443156 RepID=A0A1H0L4I2_9MICO|nr:MerR family transcriptional regulator [Pedococcus dokdonensis]SDO62870.1 DNA-binding transcriptional regulator, MerR family [Pedococcus dokdonensis]